MKRIWIFVVLFSLVLSACSPVQQSNESDTLSFLALDTLISLTGCGDHRTQAMNEVQKMITSLENECSRTKTNSTIYQLNHAGGTPMAVSPSLYKLLEQAQNISRMTNGAFDITIAPAADLWGFTQNAFRVPRAEELSSVKAKVGMEHLHLSEKTVQLDDGTELDLGGITKGLALEQSKDIFENYELSGGIANLGGDVLAYGVNPNGEPWRVAVRDPSSGENDTNVLGILSAANQYILTSGGYERYFEAGGIRYQHILDPSSCAPAESTLESVTIVTSLDHGAGITADALATSLFIMDYDEAVKFWRTSTIPFDMILVDASQHVYITKGLQHNFSPQKPDTYQYQVLS